MNDSTRAMRNHKIKSKLSESMLEQKNLYLKVLEMQRIKIMKAKAISSIQ